MDLNAVDSTGHTLLHHILRHRNAQSFADMLDLISNSDPSKNEWCSMPDPDTKLTPLRTLLKHASSSSRVGLMIRELLGHDGGAAAVFGDKVQSPANDEVEEGRTKNLFHFLVENGEEDLLRMAINNRGAV